MLHHTPTVTQGVSPASLGSDEARATFDAVGKHINAIRDILRAVERKMDKDGNPYPECSFVGVLSVEDAEERQGVLLVEARTDQYVMAIKDLIDQLSRSAIHHVVRYAIVKGMEKQAEAEKAAEEPGNK